MSEVKKEPEAKKPAAKPAPTKPKAGKPDAAKPDAAKSNAEKSAPAKSEKPANAKSGESASKVKAEPAKTHVESTWKHAAALTACKFDPTGKYLVSGAEEYALTRWNLADGTPTKLEGHESWCRALAFSPDGKTLYSGGYDGLLIAWNIDAEKPVPLKKIHAHDGWIRGIAVSADGKHVATCGNDKAVKIWAIAEGRLYRDLKGHESHVYNVAFHPDGKQIVSCDLMGNLIDWTIVTGKESRTFKAEALHKYDTTFRADIGGARSMAFGDGGKLLGCGGTTNVTNAFGGILEAVVVSIDWATGKVKTTHVGKQKPRSCVWGLAWHPDGYWIGMAGGRKAELLFWTPDKAEEFALFAIPEIGRDFDLQSDNLHAAIVTAEGQVKICKLGA
jgi:WD40 repeat protein